MEVKVDQLRAAIGLVLDELERLHGDSVTVEIDYFWALQAEERANVYAEPAALTIGQTSELLDDVSNILDHPEKVTVLHAVKFAELLRTVGEAQPC